MGKGEIRYLYYCIRGVVSGNGQAFLKYRVIEVESYSMLEYLPDELCPGLSTSVLVF